MKSRNSLPTEREACKAICLAALEMSVSGLSSAMQGMLTDLAFRYCQEPLLLDREFEVRLGNGRSRSSMLRD